MLTDRPRAVFMGTPDFAVPSLHALLGCADVLAVLTQPDRPAGRGRRLRASPVKAAALEAGVPVRQPASLRREPDVLAHLSALAPDIIVVAAYGLILPQAYLDIPSHGAINVHASLLPRWRGAAPVVRAIMAGDDETGICLMLMEAGLDTGPILVTRTTAILPEETGTGLTARLASMGADLLAETLPLWLAGTIRPASQPAAGATYAERITAVDRQIDWTMPAATLARQVRALAEAPGAHALWDDMPLVILEARAVPGPADLPGRLRVVDGRPQVASGSGWLELATVKPAGGRAMRGQDFARGRPHLAGAFLSGPAEPAPAPTAP